MTHSTSCLGELKIVELAEIIVISYFHKSIQHMENKSKFQVYHTTVNSGLDKKLDYWVFHSLLFSLTSILLPT